MSKIHSLILSDTPEEVGQPLLMQYASSENIDALDSNGMSPVHLAIIRKKDLYLKVLVKLKAQLETVGSTGMTPIQTAVTTGTFNSVKILTEAGAKLDIIWFPSENNPWSLLDLLHLRTQQADSSLMLDEQTAMIRFLCQKGVKHIAAEVELPGIEKKYEDVVATTNGPLIFSRVMPSTDRPDYMMGKICISDTSVQKPTNNDDKPGTPDFKPGFLAGKRF